MSKRTGIREIAAYLGVSVGSVSTAINQPHLVSAAMKERVEAAAEALGFVRNGLARQLRMGGSTTLGMITLDIANPFFAKLSAACQRVAEDHGYALVTASTELEPAREERFVRLFEEQRAAGLLISAIDGLTDAIRRAQDRGMPMVLFDDQHREGNHCTIALDGVEAGRMAAEHLVETGRKRICFIGGPRDLTLDRWRGAEEVCRSAGVHLEYVPTTAQTVELGRKAATSVVTRPASDRPDAIFAANDVLALGALQSVLACPELQVPRDIAIIGVDDIYLAESAAIPLSSIRQPVEEIARISVELLLDQIAKGPLHVHEHRRLHPTLTVRASSATD